MPGVQIRGQAVRARSAIHVLVFELPALSEWRFADYANYGRLAEWIDDHDAFYLASVSHVLGIEFAASECARRDDDGAIPI